MLCFCFTDIFARTLSLCKGVLLLNGKYLFFVIKINFVLFFYLFIWERRERLYLCSPFTNITNYLFHNVFLWPNILFPRTRVRVNETHQFCGFSSTFRLFYFIKHFQNGIFWKLEEFRTNALQIIRVNTAEMKFIYRNRTILIFFNKAV